VRLCGTVLNHLESYKCEGCGAPLALIRYLSYVAGRRSLTFNHTHNSAVCSGSVWALNNNTANLTTMCAGSKTSGKSDMSMMNLFIPGSQIKASAAQFLKRISEMGGPSVLALRSSFNPSRGPGDLLPSPLFPTPEENPETGLLPPYTS
jgi:hypothetical protein